MYIDKNIVIQGGVCGERWETVGDRSTVVRCTYLLSGSYLNCEYKQVRFIRSDPYLHILSRTLIGIPIRVIRI